MRPEIVALVALKGQHSGHSRHSAGDYKVIRREGIIRIAGRNTVHTKCQKHLTKHGFKVSMSGKGKCYGNSMVLRRESAPLGPFLILLTFFRSTKAKLIWRRRWGSWRQAEGAIFQYTNGFYHPWRRHSSLRGKAPWQSVKGCINEARDRNAGAIRPKHH